MNSATSIASILLAALKACEPAVPDVERPKEEENNETDENAE